MRNTNLSTIFQFHKGTIKALPSILAHVAHLPFNSIKVQLRQVDEMDDNGKPTFQFHKGTIKARLKVKFLSKVLSFNSIKVQLRLDFISAHTNNVANFQFHKGTIKATTEVC